MLQLILIVKNVRCWYDGIRPKYSELTFTAYRVPSSRFHTDHEHWTSTCAGYWKDFSYWTEMIKMYDKEEEEKSLLLHTKFRVVILVLFSRSLRCSTDIAGKIGEENPDSAG